MKYRREPDLLDRIKSIMDRLLALEKRGANAVGNAAVPYFYPDDLKTTTSASPVLLAIIPWSRNRSRLEVTVYSASDFDTSTEFSLTNADGSTVYDWAGVDDEPAYATLTVDTSAAPSDPVYLRFYRQNGTGTCKAVVSSVVETSA